MSIEPTRIYQFADARAFLADSDLDTEVLAQEVSGRVMGAFIRAQKPHTSACCGPTCCGPEAKVEPGKP